MHVYISETMKDILALGSALLVLTVFAAWHPTGDFVSSPSYWVDEAVSVEKARNFLAYGELDVAVAPGVLSGKPYATAAAGPLLTLPLAGFFSIFGIGIAQVRIYMLMWLFLLVSTAYFFVRKLCGRREALFVALLVVTFSPLYANGKTATGDIPGFVALLFALYYLYMRGWDMFSGILLGLATVTKPSLYMPVVLVALLEILFSESEKRLRRAFDVVLGGLIILIPWTASLSSNPFSKDSWREVYNFFRDPFPTGSSTVFDLLHRGDVTYLFHTTVLYYLALCAGVSFAVWLGRNRRDAEAHIMRFCLLYACAAFILYVRSPGWLRYLLSGTLLLFFIFPSAIQIIFHEKKWRYAVPSRTRNALYVSVICFQAVHFFFFSWRTASDAVMRDSIFLQQLIGSDSTIGFIDSPTLASLIDSTQKYQVARISGNTVLGESPLRISPDKLPGYLFIPFNRFGDESRREFVDPYADVLEDHYADYTPPGARFSLYKKL